MTTRKEISERIAELEDIKDVDTGKLMGNSVMEGMKSGLSPKEMFDLSDEIVETVYSHAYNLYNRGKYDDSLLMFKLLIFLDPEDPRYRMGIAACYHLLKEYEVAMSMYLLAGTLGDNDPLPFYHAADCCSQMDSAAAASMMLETCIAECQGKPEYRIIEERSKMMIDALKEKSDAELAKAAETAYQETIKEEENKKKK
jgi:type III secretion system low calcium response chaperone LcrH/SycD